MRILIIRFKNLNSLKGEWEIDLTHPDFTGTGIFAISGPTGSGKSTILDAISLALYGCTPRLDKVTAGGGNEIMSRQTGDCFAEVTFETNLGKFRVMWEQHRSRNSFTGALQPAFHEIVDVTNNAILATGIEPVQKKVIEVTGFDFNRFTRSVMLAQGGFAAFLQAKTDERSEILEQITGTGLYSKLSMAVNKRKSDEFTTLRLLETGYHAVPLLTDDEVEDCKQALSRLAKTEHELSICRAQTASAIEWLNRCSALEKDANQIAEEQIRLQSDIEAFAPEKVKLERALEARELEGDAAALDTVRREQQEARTQIERALRELPVLEAACSHAQMDEKIKADAYAGAKALQEKDAALIREVRGIDLVISEKRIPVDSLEVELAELEKKLDLHKQKRIDCRQALDKQQDALDRVNAIMQESKDDGGLIESLAGIDQRIEQLLECAKHLKREREALAGARKMHAETEDMHRDAVVNLKKLMAEVTIAEKACAATSDLIAIKLDGRKLTEIRSQLESFREEMGVVEKCSQAQAEHAAAIVKMAEVERLAGEVAANIIGERKHEAELEQKRESLTREITLLEEQFYLVATIESFEDARQKHLHKGEACPLCGSLDHPWGSGIVNKGSDVKAALATQRENQKAITDQLNSCMVTMVRLTKDKERISSELDELNAKIAFCENQIAGFCSSLTIDKKIPELETVLTERLNAVHTRINGCTLLLKEIEALLEEQERQHETLTTMQRAATLASKHELELHHQKESARNAELLKMQEVDILISNGKSIASALTSEIAQYNVGSISSENAPDVKNLLHVRKDAWVKHAQEKQKIENEILMYKQQLGQLDITIQNYESDITTKKGGLAALKDALGELVLKRDHLFGTKNCDEEEHRIEEHLHNILCQYDAAHDTTMNAVQKLDRVRQRIADLKHAVDEREVRLGALEEEFRVRLARNRFSDEAAFRNACLSEVERKLLEEKSSGLARKKHILDERMKTVREQLLNERRSVVTNSTLEHLIADAERIDQELREVQKETGALQHKIDEYENSRAEKIKRENGILFQKKECRRWDDLNRLIGSSDGKKFRNFAQGLTFEIMVRHANRELQKMTDRYLLVRDSEKPLELNVIDNYQDSEIRSTKNLSGGECFIVSLALALGLSKMASEKISVDSLFLDEGFGTLDEEALEVALETLAGLRQDGKLIGVISHVQALKERIGTHIEVVRQSGGRSTLKGSGCRRI